jgi:hypothetical protein
MKIRPARTEDLERLRELFRAQGYDYEPPDLAAPAIAMVLVAVDENDQAVMGFAARKTVEMFCFADPAWATPKWRAEAFAELHRQAQWALEAQGYDQAHCWLPPKIARGYGRRLMRHFGWVQQLWPCFCLKKASS